MAIPPRTMSPSFRFKALNPAFQSDPRRILGQQLQQQGLSSAPVRTPLQGLGRLSSALIGAYLQKGAIDRQVARESDFQDKLTNALSGMNLPQNSPIRALFPFAPETALGAAITRDTNLEIAKAKAPATYSTPTPQEISAAGGNPDAPGFYQKNNKTNKLEFTRVDNIPKSGFPSLVNELIRIDKIAPENRTRADDLMFKFYSAQLSRDKVMPVQDEKTGNIVLRKIPGINVKAILSGETTNNEEKVSEDKVNENVVKFAKLNKTEAEYVGQLKTSQTELDKLVNILFENGDIENGAINKNVIRLLSVPGAKIFSGDAKVANNILMNLSDLTLRKRTGATANQSEIDLYYGQITPGITDGDALTRFKIQRLVRDLNNNIGVFAQGRNIKDLKPLVIKTNQASSNEEVEF